MKCPFWNQSPPPSSSSSICSSSTSSSSLSSLNYLEYAVSSLGSSMRSLVKPLKQRSVRFAEHHNESHASPFPTIDPDTVWYSHDDLDRFREDAVREAHAIRNGERGEAASYWLTCQYRKYRECCGASETLSGGFDTQECDAAFVGLQLWAIRPLLKNRRKHRQELLSAIEYWNSIEVQDETMKCRQIRQTSLALSGPSRNFARHTGRWMAS